MICKKCSGSLEPIQRIGQKAFNFCRACKLPYGDDGSLLIDPKSLNTAFNPLKIARGIIGEQNPDTASHARTALEVMLIQGLQEAYLSGLKDGVLLALSQDYTKGDPI